MIFATSKERLMQVLDNKGVERAQFYLDTGIKRGLLDADKLKSTITDIYIAKIIATYPDINIEWLLTGEGEMLKSDDESNDRYYTYLIPLTAQAGSLNDFSQAVELSDCEKIVSPINGVDWAITIYGDSMSPEYTSGSRVLIKKIQSNIFIEWGRVYVLDTANGTIIKKIMPTNDENIVQCISINESYPPFLVNLKDVFGMYRVLLCMSMK